MPLNITLELASMPYLKHNAARSSVSAFLTCNAVEFSVFNAFDCSREMGDSVLTSRDRKNLLLEDDWLVATSSTTNYQQYHLSTADYT